MTESNSSRYVIQKHTRGEDVHWDLMLEDNGRLTTWQVPVDPRTILNGIPVKIVRIQDHDLRFLQYEGPVQNNTGKVKLADYGTYLIQSKTQNALILTACSEKFDSDYTIEISKSPDWQIILTAD